MYKDTKNKNGIICGKVFEIGIKAKYDTNREDINDNYMTFWCERIPKKELYQYADFERYD